MFIVFTQLFRHFPNWNGFRMFQISAMININIKFEGSTNRPCAKRNEEQQELRRVCELQSKPLNFGLFVWSFRFVLFFFSMQTWLFWGAFLWRIRIRISDLWRSLTSKSIFRSVIYQIHSGQGFIGSLICVIWRRIIGSFIHHIPLSEGSEINNFAQRCSIWNKWVLHILTGKIVGNHSTNSAIDTK